MIVQQRVATYLRTERSELKESKLAEKAGIRQARFSMLMNGRSEMRADEFMAICNALNVSPNMFIKPKKE